MTVFEVDRTCVGATQELDEHGVETGRQLRSIADLQGLLRLASRYARVRIVPPASCDARHRLELFGPDEGGLAIRTSTTFEAIGVEIPGSEWERLAAGIERRYLDVSTLEGLLRIADHCGYVDVEYQPGARHPFRLTAVSPATPRRRRPT